MSQYFLSIFLLVKLEGEEHKILPYLCFYILESLRSSFFYKFSKDVFQFFMHLKGP